MERYAKMKADGLSWTQLTKVYNVDNGTNLTKDQVRDRVRKAYDKLVKPVIPRNNKTVGFSTDKHMPFMHPNYLEFLYDTYNKWKVDEAVDGGDLFDNHAISRHETEPEAYGADREYYMAMEQVEPYKKMFPKMKIMVGNHDLIPERQAKTLGLGKNFVKRIEDIYEFPKGWELMTEYTYQDVMYCHGLGYGGKDGAINGAIKNRMSLAMGHTHAFAGCKYMANSSDIIFGLNAGCGIDVEAYAFAYGKHIPNKPILGCGIIISNEEAYFIPMGEKYFRSNK